MPASLADDVNHSLCGMLSTESGALAACDVERRLPRAALMPASLVLGRYHLYSWLGYGILAPFLPHLALSKPHEVKMRTSVQTLRYGIIVPVRPGGPLETARWETKK